jgi:hypothetical protein
MKAEAAKPETAKVVAAPAKTKAKAHHHKVKKAEGQPAAPAPLAK